MHAHTRAAGYIGGSKIVIDHKTTIGDTAPCGETTDRSALPFKEYGEGMALAYDALMREDYSYTKYADYIEAIFKKHGMPPEPLIADLGCGTGSLCIELARRGYGAIGIDSSPHMLAEARRKALDGGAPDILFLEQELDAFELFGSVGAFVSTVDSLNYITDKRRLRRVFRLVGNYLASGGLFIFDLNTERKLSRGIGGGVFYEITDDICYLWESKYYSANKTSVFDLTFFARGRDGRWSRFDEIHRQRAYTRADIESAISGTGLSIAGHYGFLTFNRPSGKANKAVYIMTKTDRCSDSV
ncbi:MAG: class I SAM-dependent methyltransferase [Oscillospiraceae bacterium]|nr:class I SAM-dependent methyltransferase [Oscillospiraceae bacterium]